MAESDWQTAAATLRLSAQLVDGIQDGLAARGFTDVRPVHGFAFAAIANSATTAAGLAAALGVTKQAAAQLIDHLVSRGYVSRRPDPRDARAQLLVLTDRGRACTLAAEQAAGEVIQRWRDDIPAATFSGFQQTVHAVARPGRLRPAW